MTTTPTRYPLQWPLGWKRSGAYRRGKFSCQRTDSKYLSSRPITVAEAVQRLVDELQRMGAIDVIISTNLHVRQDGLPRSGQAAPFDPGAAVYWRKGKETKCMAIDLYSQVEQNIAALAATLDAMRAIERHGGAAVMDRAFSGFMALPEQSTAKTWLYVLDLPATATQSEIDARFKTLSKLRHPDVGGTPEEWQELLDARHQALMCPLPPPNMP